jgi:hypothetical protein
MIFLIGTYFLQEKPKNHLKKPKVVDFFGFGSGTAGYLGFFVTSRMEGGSSISNEP